jgi:hypothetical protein
MWKEAVVAYSEAYMSGATSKTRKEKKNIRDNQSACYRVDVDSVVDLSEVYSASIFSTVAREILSKRLILGPSSGHRANAHGATVQQQH